MNENQAAKWNRTRTLGRSKYILYYGVLAWSLLLTLLFGAIEYATQGETFWGWIPIRLFVFAVVGFFVGNGIWESREKRFNNQAKKG